MKGKSKLEASWNGIKRRAIRREGELGLKHLVLPFIIPALAVGHLWGAAVGPVTVQSGQVYDYPEAGFEENVETSGNVVIESGGDSIFYATDSISLLPGFHAKSGSLFKAMITSGSSPLVFSRQEEQTDTDQDGIFDAKEIHFGMNPNNAADAGEDWDFDGILNSSELQAFSDPGVNYSPVGSLPGELSVDNRGASSYSIPIEVIPGTGGVQPKLALSYSSQGGSGFLGQGWNLSGLSAITRIPTTTALDNGYSATSGSEFARSGVHFDSSDHFALDGQRLMLYHGIYGAANSEYRTEIDSFSRITAVGTQGNGPQYFEVETKDGLKMTYGQTPSAQLKPAGKSEVLSWSLDKVEDSLGNQMTFVYTTNSSTGEQKLTDIHYSFNGSSYTHCNVHFDYESRTLSDYVTRYIDGGKIEIQNRLKSISIRENGVEIKQYTLNYANSSQTKKSLLTSVQLTSSGKNLPATTFAYQNGGSNDLTLHVFANETISNYDGSTGEPCKLRPIDFEGDGRMELLQIYRDGGSYQVKVFKHSANPGVQGGGTWQEIASKTITGVWDFNLIREGDFNGDGLTDFVCVTWDAEYLDTIPPTFLWQEIFKVYLSDGNNGFIEKTLNGDIFSAPLGLGDPGPQFPDYTLEISDLNGDGRSEFSAFYRNDSHGSGTDSISYRFYQITNNSTNAISLLSRASVALENCADYTISSGYFVDMNADGMSDYLFSSKDDSTNKRYVKVLISNGFQPTTYGPAFETATLTYDLGTWMNDSTIFPVDMNGDGNTDLVYSYKTGSTIFDKYYLGTGSGFEYTGTHSFTASVNWATEHYVYPTEINGDGRGDIIHIFKGSGDVQARIYRSTGKDFDDLAVYTELDMGVWPTTGFFLPTELDGDGKADFLVCSEGASNAVLIKPWYSGGNVHDLLTHVTNGLGAQTEISYAPLTGNIYVKDAEVATEYPIMQLQAAMYAAEYVGKDDGLGLPNTNYRTSYTYTGGQVDLWGRGFQGFRIFTSLDEQKNHRKTQVLEQEFPYTGMVKESETEVKVGANWYYVTRTTNTLTENTITTERGNSVSFFPFIDNSTTDTYELANSNPYQRVKTDNTFGDHWGNNTEITIEYQQYDGTSATTDRKIKTVNSFYTPYTAQDAWVLSRLSQTEVTFWDGTSQESQKRKSTFTYYSSASSFHGMLQTETLEPGTSLALTSTYAYDTKGNISTKTVTGGSGGSAIPSATTTYLYDSTYRYNIKTTNALSHEVEQAFGRAGFGVATSMTDPNDLVVDFSYDAFGRPYREQRPDGTYSRTYRIPNGEGNGDWVKFSGAKYALVSESLLYGQSYAAPVYTYYDRLGREIGSDTQVYYAGTPGGRTVYTEIEYDAFGRTSRTSDPYVSGETIRWTTNSVFDELSRPKEIRKGSERGDLVTLISYNKFEVTTTNPKGQISKKQVNAAGDTVLTTDDDGNTVASDYDGYGNLKSTTSPGNLVVTMNYDVRGNKTSMSDPNMGNWQYTYDALGRLKTQTDAKSNVTTLVYDALGRMTSRTIGSLSYSWGYDTAGGKGVGQIATESGPDNYSKAFTYDSLGRLITEATTIDADGAGPAQAETYHTDTSYDLYGRVATIAYPNNYWIENVYDSGGTGALIEVEDKFGTTHWSAPKYNGRGQIEEYQIGSAASPLVVSQAYEEGTGFTETIKAQVSGSGSYIQNMVFGFDHLGNLTSRSKSTGTSQAESLYYDDLNRLIQSSITGGMTTYATYQANGNIATRGGYSYTYHSSKINQVTSFRGKSYVYDANGNMTSRAGDTLTWTAFNKPSRITQSGSGDYVEFLYDANHHRTVEKFKEGSTTRTKIIVGLYEKEDDGTTLRERCLIPTPTGVVGSYTVMDAGVGGAETYYFLKDHLGSVLFVLDDSYNVEEEFFFNAWGEKVNPNDWDSLYSTWSNSWKSGDRGYTGHELLNDLKLVHMNGRIYDPFLGRFLSADPFVQFPDNPQSYNRYSYVLNNPLSYTDPSGFFLPLVPAVLFKIGLLNFAEFIVTTFIASTVQSMLMGASFKDAIIGGVVGTSLSAISMGVADGIGSLDLGIGGDIEFLAKAFLHGVTQGGINELGGGDFTSGFLGGLASHMTSKFQIKGLGTPQDGNNVKMVARTMVAATVGGTVASIGGGKFANGAISAAFVHLYNAEGHNLFPSSVSWTEEVVDESLYIRRDMIPEKFPEFAESSIDAFEIFSKGKFQKIMKIGKGTLKILEAIDILAIYGQPYLEHVEHYAPEVFYGPDGPYIESVLVDYKVYQKFRWITISKMSFLNMEPPETIIKNDKGTFYTPDNDI